MRLSSLLLVLTLASPLHGAFFSNNGDLESSANVFALQDSNTGLTHLDGWVRHQTPNTGEHTLWFDYQVNGPGLNFQYGLFAINEGVPGTTDPFVGPKLNAENLNISSFGLSIESARNPINDT